MLVHGHTRPCGHTAGSCRNVRQISELWPPKIVQPQILATIAAQKKVCVVRYSNAR